MKIKLSAPDLLKVKKLLDTKDSNLNVADMYLYYLDNESHSINKVMIDKIRGANKCSENYAFYLALMKILNVDMNDENNINLGAKYCVKSLKKLNPNEYRDNPYYRNIHAAATKSGKWRLEYETYLPYEGFVYDDLIVDKNDNYMEISRIGFFDEKFSYLAVSEDDVNWMSVTPSEIETMKDAINQVKGNVVCYGLGLGYFAYMVSIKDDVNEVTIIEKDTNIVKIFTDYILPQFSHKEKIKIVMSDAFDYAQNDMNKAKFDYAFVDLWHNAGDGLGLYLKMKKLEYYNQNTTFLYWLETSILTILRRCVLIILNEQMNGTTDSDYEKAENDNDKIINQLYKCLHNYPINTYYDIFALISDESLRNITKKL